MRRLFGIAAVVGWLGIAGAASAAPGDLDATFGNAGLVTTPFTGADSGGASGLVIQPDGRIVAGGFAIFGSSFQFAIARYLPNGALDQDFGDGGVTVTDITSASSESADGLARQPDGRLVLAGSATVSGNTMLALARYHANGVLDSSFDQDGKVLTDVQTTTFEQAKAVALQSTGDIVVAGDGQSANGNEIVLARYLQNGTLDSSFGTAGNGKLVIPVTSPHAETASSLLVLPDDSLLIGGSVSTTGSNEQFLLRHLSKNGGIDGTFGDASGRLITSFPGAAASEQVNGLAREPDGRIVAVGSSFEITGNEKFELYVARYMPDGSLDQSFGGGTGREAFLLPGGVQGAASAVAIAPDGDIVIGGDGGDGDVAVVRLLPDGTIDPTFGSGGARLIDYGSQAFDGADGAAVGLQGDGSIVVAGDVQQQASPGGFALARLNGDSADLSVTASTAPSVVRPGGSETLTITAHNAGPQSAHLVTVSITPPGGSGAVAVSSAGAFTCTGTAPVSCTLSSLASGASSAITVTYSAPASGVPHAAASISSATFDPNGTNNAAGADTTLDGTPPVVHLKLGKVGLEQLRTNGRLPVSVTMSEAGRVALVAKTSGHTLARKSLSFSSGSTHKVVLRVSKKARKRLEGSESVKLRLGATASDIAGNTRTAKLTATLSQATRHA